jgi:hypothetical protein
MRVVARFLVGISSALFSFLCTQFNYILHIYTHLTTYTNEATDAMSSIACGCRSFCLCKGTNSNSNVHERPHKPNPYQHPQVVEYWPVNPCRPWISSFFGGLHDMHEFTSSNLSSLTTSDKMTHNYRREMVSTSSNTNNDIASEQQDDEPSYPKGVHKRYDNAGFPTQARRIIHQSHFNSSINPVPPPIHSIVGHPSLRIHRFRLPYHLLHLLDYIVEGCQDHASTLTNGWA